MPSQIYVASCLHLRLHLWPNNVRVDVPLSTELGKDIYTHTTMSMRISLQSKIRECRLNLLVKMRVKCGGTLA